jgi:hypothetical protein
MRIRQPFDFTDRTGIIAFDVDAMAQTPGGHGFWFNVFIADEPIPSPYEIGEGVTLFAHSGLGLEFVGGDGSIKCGNLGGGAVVNSLATVFVEDGWKITHSYPYLFDRVGDSCFKVSPGVPNHIEIHVSQTAVEVFASNAGDPSSLRSIARVDSATDDFLLPFTRGYVNFQQTHYNAAKSTVLPSYHTYHWRSVAFDGPVFATPRAYEVADALTDWTPPWAPTLTFWNTGYALPFGPTTIQGVDLTDATDAVLTLNAWNFNQGRALKYRWNGGTWHSFANPFPEAPYADGGGRPLAVPVDMTELKTGANTLELDADYAGQDIGVTGMVVANAELTINVKGSK